MVATITTSAVVQMYKFYVPHSMPTFYEALHTDVSYRSSARSAKSGPSPDVRHAEQWNKRLTEVTGTTSTLELYKRQPALEVSIVQVQFYTKSASTSRSVAKYIPDGEYRAGRKIKDFETKFKLMGVSRKSK
ncbi:hypothetical protein SCUP515_10735 [Seiridium cupressi]